MSKEKTELKPCPFCGGTDIQMGTYEVMPDCEIMCRDCRCILSTEVSWRDENNEVMSIEEHDRKCKKVLIELWNRRKKID